MTALLDRPYFTARGREPGLTDAEWAEWLAALTRREFLVAGSAALAVGSAAWTGDVAAASGATRVIDTAKGKVTIPLNPKRVVCVDPYSPFDLLGVGCTPVGIPTYTGSIAAGQVSSYQAITKITNAGGEINLEAVARLQPDLILGFDYESDYDKLSAIAPTAFFAFHTSADWPHLAAEFADAVRRGSRMTVLQQQYRVRTAHIRTTYAAVLRRYRWDLVAGFDQQAVVYFPDSGTGKVLADAGVQFARAAAGKTGAFATLSYEQIDRLSDADVIAVEAVSPGKPETLTQQLLDQSTWKLLKAAKSRHIFPLFGWFPNNYQMAFTLFDGVEATLRTLQGDHS